MSLVYLNGEYLPLNEARVSVLDRGFTFGDGVYEVLPVYNHHIFRFDQHLERLGNSLAAIHMENPLSKNKWQEILITLIEDSQDNDQSIYIQVTRGVSDRDHTININGSPTVFAMCKPIIKDDLSSGIKAITCDDIRWKLCYIKAITLLPSVLLRHEAAERGATEAILVKDNIVTEGAASNVFIVKDNIVRTPPKDGNILPGITRDLVVELLNKENIKCIETRVMKNDLFDADEIWITSSTWEIVPVIELDGQPVGSHRPGKVWKKSIAIYQQFKEKLS